MGEAGGAEAGLGVFLLGVFGEEEEDVAEVVQAIDEASGPFFSPRHTNFLTGPKVPPNTSATAREVSVIRGHPTMKPTSSNRRKAHEPRWMARSAAPWENQSRGAR